MSTTPRRIEWTGPEGWIVWADEDGVHLRSSDGRALEQPDVERLFALWREAVTAMDADHVAAPKPPTREELRQERCARHEDAAKKRAVRAINNEFTPF